MIQQKLSLFQCLTSVPSKAVGLEEVVRLIRYDNGVTAKTENYRRMASVLGKEKADEEVKKKLVPAFSVGVLFDGNGRGAANVLAGSAMLMLPISVFLSIYSVLMACTTASLMQTMMSFQRNQQKPEALRDDMFHQVRNLAQPLVMVIPMLYAGMLQGGVSPFDGLLVTLLLIAASFVANILAGFVALGMIKKHKV